MLTIVDIIRQNDEHGTTNEPSMQALCENQQVTEVWLSHNSSAIPNVELQTGINLLKVTVSNDKYYRWVRSFQLTLKVLLKNNQDGRKVFFLSAIPLHYLLITLVSFFSKKTKHRFLLFMHGELGYLNQADCFGQRLGAFFIKLAFNLSIKCKVTYLALGYPIYMELLQRFPHLKYNLDYLEIPSTELPAVASNAKTAERVRFGTFGVQTQDKSSDKIYQVAEGLTDKAHMNFELITVGLAGKNFSYDQHPNVTHLCRGRLGVDYIPRENFVSAVKTLDWALFFYDHNQKYGLVPSGIFYDCINFGIPIIALRSRVFEFYFQRYGALGVLCNSTEDMVEAISKIMRREIRPDDFIEGLVRASEDISFPHFRRKLLELVATEKY